MIRFIGGYYVYFENRGDIIMRYNHKKRLMVTSRRETQLLMDAKRLL